MFLIFFLISFLFSLAPQTLLLPMENILDPSIKKMTAKTPSYSRFLKLSLDSNNKRFLNLTPPSFYLSRFQNRIDQTKAWAQTKQYKGILKHLESKIPTGSFSKPQVVELQNGPHLGERFVFIKPELTSRHKGTLYSQKPLKERKQIQQFYKKMEDKFLLNQIPSPQMMRVHSFDSIMTSQFQFLIEIFEHRPYLWTTLSSQQQVSLLLLLSQTLILSNEYSIAKRIAFFLEHFCYSFLTSTQRGMIPFLIDGLFPSVIFQFVDSKYLPYNFTSLHSSFKHRWMSLCRYQGIAPITYTWQDFNLVPLLDGDLIHRRAPSTRYARSLLCPTSFPALSSCAGLPRPLPAPSPSFL